MSESDPLSPQRVSELVTSNRIIRAPFFEKEADDGLRFTDVEKGLQWGADAVPAMMGLFRVETAPRDDHPDGWVGFARHWRGGTLRLDFDLYAESDGTDPLIVVTAIAARSGEHTFVDEDFGTVEVPDEIPTPEDWEDRENGTKPHGKRTIRMDA